MNKKTKTLSIAASTALATTLAMSTPANAAENPFATNDLGSGYQLAFADKKAEGQCGSNHAKQNEGNCGGTKKQEEEMKKKEKTEGKCGEGKCGGDKK